MEKKKSKTNRNSLFLKLFMQWVRQALQITTRVIIIIVITIFLLRCMTDISKVLQVYRGSRNASSCGCWKWKHLSWTLSVVRVQTGDRNYMVTQMVI